MILQKQSSFLTLCYQKSFKVKHMQIPGDPINVQSRPSLLSRRSIDPLSKYPQNRQSMKEVNQLVKNIKQLKQKNKNLYQQIIKKDSKFTIKLYCPQIPCRIIIQQIKITQQKLLRELDKLYEQNSDLTKQLNKLDFRQQNQQMLKDQSLLKNMNHYQFLRSTWKKQLMQNQKSQNLLQRLTQNVALIRGHINLTIKKEQVSHEKMSKQIQAAYSLQQNSKRYEKLLKNYQHFQMSYQDQNSKKINDQSLKLQFVNNTLNQNNQKLEIQLQKNNQKIAELEQKVKNLQRKLFKKQSQVFGLNQKLNQKQQILSKYKKESLSRRVCIFQSAVKLAQNSDQSQYEVKIFSKQLFTDKINEKIKVNATFAQIMAFFQSKISLKEQKQENNQQIVDKNDKIRPVLQELSLNFTNNLAIRKSFNPKDNNNLNKMIFTQRYSIPRKNNSSVNNSFSKKEENKQEKYKIQDDFLIQISKQPYEQIKNKQRNVQYSKNEHQNQNNQKPNIQFQNQEKDNNCSFSQIKFIRTNINGRGKRRDSIR